MGEFTRAAPALASATALGPFAKVGCAQEFDHPTDGKGGQEEILVPLRESKQESVFPLSRLLMSARGANHTP